MKLRSLRFKVSVLYTGILGLILLSYSLFLYFNLNYVVFHEIDVNLRKKTDEIQKIIYLYSEAFEPKKEDAAVSLQRALHLEEQESSEFFQWPSIKRLDQTWRSTIQALGIKQDYIVIFSPSGEIVEKSYNVDHALLTALKSRFQLSPVFTTGINNILVKDRQLRVISRPLYLSGQIKYIIQLATPTDSRHILLKSKMKLIMITIPIFLLATSFLGVFFVNRIFKPVHEITWAARQISHKDMSQRLQLEHTDEEIKSLVDAFNEMIAGLERSFRHIEDFSSNVAHELKTPLAIIQGELEVTLRKERTSQEYRKAIQVVIEEVQRVMKTVNDLLLLARLDYQTEVLSLEPVELNDFLKSLCGHSALMATEKNIRMNIQALDQPLIVSADSLHLRRLFLNLIDNAIKFTPPNGRVDIRVEREDQMARVSIRDTGIGIKEEILPKIFDRFFYSRQMNPSAFATGLGLSIVQSIAKIHKGTVQVSSRPGEGTVFTVFLPLEIPAQPVDL